MATRRTSPLDAGTRRWSEALSEEIAHHPGSRDEVLRLVLRELRSRLGLDAALSYGVSLPEDSLRVEFGHGLALRSDMQALLQRYLQGRRPERWGFFNPGRPEPSQRNRVRTMRDDLAPKAPPAEPDFEAANREAGTHQLDQIRVLICEGPSLVAWVGGFRHDSITRADRAAFAALVPALRRRLVLEQSLRQTRLRSSALDVVLDALSGAAFILRDDGGILLANAAGRALLDTDGACTRERLRASVTTPGCDATVELTPFPVPGEKARLLALVRPSSQQDALVRARLLGARWGLTPRHVQVLERLAWGASNKAIAAQLGCAEGTVELHLAAMMRRAQVASRAELIARFWTLPAGL